MKNGKKTEAAGFILRCTLEQDQTPGLGRIRSTRKDQSRLMRLPEYEPVSYLTRIQLSPLLPLICGVGVAIPGGCGSGMLVEHASRVGWSGRSYGWITLGAYRDMHHGVHWMVLDVDSRIG